MRFIATREQVAKLRWPSLTSKCRLVGFRFVKRWIRYTDLKCFSFYNWKNLTFLRWPILGIHLFIISNIVIIKFKCNVNLINFTIHITVLFYLLCNFYIIFQILSDRIMNVNLINFITRITVLFIYYEILILCFRYFPIG